MAYAGFCPVTAEIRSTARTAAATSLRVRKVIRTPSASPHSGSMSTFTGTPCLHLVPGMSRTSEVTCPVVMNSCYFMAPIFRFPRRCRTSATAVPGRESPSSPGDFMSQNWQQPQQPGGYPQQQGGYPQQSAPQQPGY